VSGNESDVAVPAIDPQRKFNRYPGVKPDMRMEVSGDDQAWVLFWPGGRGPWRSPVSRPTRSCSGLRGQSLRRPLHVQPISAVGAGSAIPAWPAGTPFHAPDR